MFIIFIEQIEFAPWSGLGTMEANWANCTALKFLCLLFESNDKIFSHLSFARSRAAQRRRVGGRGFFKSLINVLRWACAHYGRTSGTGRSALSAVCKKYGRKNFRTIQNPARPYWWVTHRLGTCDSAFFPLILSRNIVLSQKLLVIFFQIWK